MGRPSVRLTCTPSPRPPSSAAASCSRLMSAVTRTVELVTMPCRWANRMPALTPGVMPKSSALTMSRRIPFSSRARSRVGPLNDEALDRRRHSGGQRSLGIELADVLEPLVSQPRERLGLARHDGGHEALALELGKGRLAAEEAEDGEDQPAAGVQMGDSATD